MKLWEPLKGIERSFGMPGAYMRDNGSAPLFKEEAVPRQDGESQGCSLAEGRITPLQTLLAVDVSERT
jgi:hypothetical protein